MIKTIDFYRYPKPPLRFCFFDRLPLHQKEEFLWELRKKNPMLEIISYCVMPNHLHFLLRLLVDVGASDFMRNIQHSYSKYFNTKNGRSDSLFQGMFKAVLIETEEQLVHVSHYIHLNSVSTYLIEIDELENYQWFSFPDYIGKSSNSFPVDTKHVLGSFKSVEDYRQFVFDQADYQRELKKIKHLVLE